PRSIHSFPTRRSSDLKETLAPAFRKLCATVSAVRNVKSFSFSLFIPNEPGSFPPWPGSRNTLIPFKLPFVCFFGVSLLDAFVFSVAGCPLVDSFPEEEGESVNQEATQPVSPEDVVTWCQPFSVFFKFNDSLFCSVPAILYSVPGPLRKRTSLAFT